MLFEGIDKLKYQSARLNDKFKRENSVIQELKKRTEIIRGVTESLEPGSEPPEPYKLKELLSNLQSDDYLVHFKEKRKLRLLSQSLSTAIEGTRVFMEDELFRRATQIIREYGQANLRVYKGLIFSLISGWPVGTLDNSKLFLELTQEVGSKLNLRKEEDMLLYRNLHFFTDLRGPSQLLTEFAHQPFHIITEQLGLPRFYWSALFFQHYISLALRGSRVLHNGFKPTPSDIVQALFTQRDEKWLNIYKTIGKNGRVGLYSQLILHANTYPYHDKEIIKQKALEAIGDPGVDANWPTSSFAFDSELEQDISAAAETLEGWLNEELFETFFKFIPDERRKDFWSRYIKQMRNVKLLIDKYWFDRLPEALKDNETFVSRLRRSNSGIYFLFELNDSAFLEFGEHQGGSLQVWTKTNPIFLRAMRDIDSHRFGYGFRGYRNTGRGLIKQKLKEYRIEQELIPWAENVYQQRRDFSVNEGHFAHRGDWESRLLPWLRKREINEG